MANAHSLPKASAVTFVARQRTPPLAHINSNKLTKFKIAHSQFHPRPGHLHCARAAADNDDAPEWLQNLQELAEEDEELAELLRSVEGDPEALESRMRAEMDSLRARIVGPQGSGEEAPPEITFRAVDPFDLWVWMELYSPPSSAELEMIQEVVNSWFMLGRLGAYDSGNLQVLYSGGGSERLEYEQGDGGALPATMHDMGEVEANGRWVRFWVDMGTSDELALDILINAIMTFSRDHVGVQQLVFGGQNEDWPTPERSMPQVSIDPLRFVE